MKLTCFKAYDVRGKLGESLDEEIAQRIGRAFAHVLNPGTVVVGYDARETSPALAAAVTEGLTERGVDVIDIGQCGTEEVYFATPHLGAGGGIMVTASHNPIDYNGMKMVGEGSRPIDPLTEMETIRAAAEADHYDTPPAPGSVTRQNTRPAYAVHSAGLVDAAAIGPLKVVVNAGNGTAGAAWDAIAEQLIAKGAKLEVTRMHHEPDATFPNGIPNPLLIENRGQTADAVRAAGADLGLAWDGDFDRCFFFDADGGFIDGEYVVALLAQSVLAAEPGATIVHDPRVIWATQDTVAKAGGRTIASRTGHAFLKGAMREAGAAYGGEMSAHHYFRDFFFCDTGMIPALKVMELVSTSGRSLADLVAEMQETFPSSGEINFRVDEDPKALIEAVVEKLGPEAQEIDRLDGASLDFGTWRMNLRASNTEPLLRLNLETRGDKVLLSKQLEMVKGMIEAG